MRELNYGAKPERTKAPAEEKLIKNQECASCANMYDCKGKRRDVTVCLNYKERAKQNSSIEQSFYRQW